MFSSFTEWIILIKIQADANGLFLLSHHFYTDITQLSSMELFLIYSIVSEKDQTLRL